MNITLSTSSNKNEGGRRKLKSKTTSPPNIHSIPITYPKNNQVLPQLYQTIIAKDIRRTKSLLSKGANPDLFTITGETPLYLAVKMNLVAQVKLLLTYNANPNINTLEGITPLMCAVKNFNFSLVKILLESKAIPNLKDIFEEQTALHLAFKLDVDLKIIQILIQHDASLICKDRNGKAPIDYADKKNEELMNFLIMHNLSLNDDNLISNGLSPFSSLLSSTSTKKQNYLISTPEDSIANYKDENPFTFEKDIAVFSSISKPHPLTNDFIPDDKAKEIISEDCLNKNTLTPYHNNNSIIFNRNSSSESENDLDYSPSKNSKRHDNNINTPNKHLQLTDQEIEFEFNCTDNSNNKSLARNSDSAYKVHTKKIAYHNTHSHSQSQGKDEDHHKKTNINKSHIAPIPLVLPIQSTYSLNNSLEEPVNSRNTNIFKNTDISTKAYSTNSHNLPTQSYLLNPQQQYFSNEEQAILGLNNFIKQTDKSKEKKSTVIEWLKNTDLLNYWDILNNDKIDRIESLIEQARTQTIKMNYEDIEKIGIKKPGHIYRFILHIQCDGGLFDMKLLHVLFGKKRMNDFIAFTMSNNSSKCNCCFLNQSYTKEDLDLKFWLRKRDLLHLMDHFIYNGFEVFGYVLLQMFSSFPLDENILRDSLHIYNQKDNQLLLKELKKECIRISQKYDIPLIGIESECEDFNQDTLNCNLCTIF